MDQKGLRIVTPTAEASDTKILVNGKDVTRQLAVRNITIDLEPTEPVDVKMYCYTEAIDIVAQNAEVFILPEDRYAYADDDLSITACTMREMKRAGYGDSDMRVMHMILRTFFAQWNSGGAVWAMLPVLMRVIRGLPLSPLTGEPEEWISRNEIEEGMMQNRRRGSVLMRNGKAYDVNNPAWGGTFPYMPTRDDSDPVMVFETKSDNGKADGESAQANSDT